MFLSIFITYTYQSALASKRPSAETPHC